jgi:hypothetical protein
MLSQPDKQNHTTTSFPLLGLLRLRSPARSASFDEDIYRPIGQFSKVQFNKGKATDGKHWLANYPSNKTLCKGRQKTRLPDQNLINGASKNPLCAAAVQRYTAAIAPKHDKD